MWVLASCPPQSCVFSCALPFSCFERKPKFWRIWETPLAMPLVCISPCVLGSPVCRALFPLNHPKSKRARAWPSKTCQHDRKKADLGFLSALSFTLAKIQLNKSVPGLYPLLLPTICTPRDWAVGPRRRRLYVGWPEAPTWYNRCFTAWQHNFLQNLL